MKKYLALAAVLALPAGAGAASVYLNGVNIDGVTSQTFENCTVQIDANGNVLITAKGYAVQGGAGDAAPPSTAGGGPPSRRYWLVTEKAAPGMTQYDIDLFINAKWVRKFLDKEEQVVMEITKHLQAGRNKVSFIAKKNVGDVRVSTSPQHYFRIIIGEGNSGGRNVMISRKAIEYKRTALESKDFQDELILVAQ
ncbi:MAG: hypothetical protein HYZ27_07190 [Deltaproteobacteria bacterium]|nr:hypothetical protein [Deltaproteobacteria bacterium]